jgi:hypothetical protein
VFLRRLAQRTQWGMLLKLVSPSFFDVLPSSALRTEAGILMRSARDREAQSKMLQAREPVLDRLGWERADSARGQAEPDEAFGQDLLTLYFTQLLAFDDAVLDLRAQAFERSGDAVRWAPRLLHVAWEPEFIAEIRNLYRGFYEDDEALFENALEALGMPGTGDLFRAHFGEDQHAVEFDLQKFQHTFHLIFERCKTDGLKLHHNFISFGVYLGTLYENLDRSGRSFDVHRVYFRARDLANELP